MLTFFLNQFLLLSIHHGIVYLRFCNLSYNLCSYIFCWFYKHYDFLKQMIVLLVIRLCRILLISGISVRISVGISEGISEGMSEGILKKNSHPHEFYSFRLPK